MNKNIIRCHWVDNLKFFALFLVVFGHIVTSQLHDVIYGFHMPLFFFISGMFHKEKNFENICKRLLLPYLLLNVLFLIMESPWIYRQEGSLNFITNDILGIIFPQEHPIDYPTWFLLSLFEVKLIIKLLKNRMLLIFCSTIICLLICCLCNLNFQLPFFLKNTLIGLAFYSIGYFTCCKFKHLVFTNKHHFAYISVGVTFVVLYFILMLNTPSCVWNEAIELPNQFIYSLLGCYGFAFLFKGAFHQRYSIIEQSCKGAIAIIGFHPLIIQYLRRFIQLFGGNWDKMDIAECFSASIVVIALCISIIPFLKKYPLLIGLNK